MPRKTRCVSPGRLPLYEPTPPKRLFIGLLPEADVQSARHAQQGAWRGHDEVLARYPATAPSVPTNAPCSPSGSE